jgi:hypothetical protein
MEKKPKRKYTFKIRQPKVNKALKVKVQNAVVLEQGHDQGPNDQLEKDLNAALPVSSNSITPRTAFSKAYFTKPVTMLNKYPEDLESVSQRQLLFQVSFTSPYQFTNYVNLSKNRPKIDCFYQSLFSIGLRDVTKAKMDSVEANEKGKKGVLVTVQTEYLKKVFGLKTWELRYINNEEVRAPDEVHNTKVTLQMIKDLLKRKLKDNHATPLNVFFYKYGKYSHGHAIIAYKYRGTIYFFDPQQKGIQHDTKIRSTTLTHLSKYAGHKLIGGFSYFMVDEQPEPREPVNLTCDIPYVG